MGATTIQGFSIADVVADRFRPRTWAEGDRAVTCRAIAHRKIGSTLWYVVERTVEIDKSAKMTERFIVHCELLADRSRSRSYGAGYKECTEHSGPYKKNCPLKFLDLVPEPEHNYNWREGVRAWHASSKEKKKKMAALDPKQGEKWRLREGLVGMDKKTPIHTARILSTAPYIRVEANDGNVYRLKKSHLAYPMGEKEVATLEEMGLEDVITAVNGLV